MVDLLIVAARVEENRVITMVKSFNIKTCFMVLGHFLVAILRPWPSLMRYPQGVYNAGIIDDKGVFLVWGLGFVGIVYPLFRIIHDFDALKFEGIRVRDWFKVRKLVENDLKLGMKMAIFAYCSWMLIFLMFGGIFKYLMQNLLMFLGYSVVFSARNYWIILDFKLHVKTLVEWAFMISKMQIVHSMTTFYYSQVSFINKPTMKFKAVTLANVLPSLGKNSTPLQEYEWFMVYNDLQSGLNEEWFRAQIYGDVDSSTTAWQIIKTNCLQQLDSMSIILENDIKGSKFEKNKLLPTDVLNDERNSIKYKKSFLKARMQVSPTKGGSILVNRRQGAVDKALSFLVEKEQEIRVAKMPVHVERENYIPSIFLSKSKDHSVKSLEFKKEEVEKTRMPGLREFLKAGCNVLKKLPLGELVLDESLYRTSEYLFKKQQLNFWALDGNFC